MVKGFNLGFSSMGFTLVLLLFTAPVGSASVVDINRVTVEQLAAFDGIGPVYAERIVMHRETHGGFDSVSDLGAVWGISKKAIARLQDLVSVDP